MIAATRSPDLVAAMALAEVAAHSLLAVLQDQDATPEQLLAFADTARRAMNELSTLAACDLRRRGGGTGRWHTGTLDSQGGRADGEEGAGAGEEGAARVAP